MNNYCNEKELGHSMVYFTWASYKSGMGLSDGHLVQKPHGQYKDGNHRGDATHFIIVSNIKGLKYQS